MDNGYMLKVIMTTVGCVSGLACHCPPKFCIFTFQFALLIKADGDIFVEWVFVFLAFKVPPFFLWSYIYIYIYIYIYSSMW